MPPDLPSVDFSQPLPSTTTPHPHPHPRPTPIPCPLSAQTRSMTKNSQVRSKLQEFLVEEKKGRTVFGGTRRKRGVLMDSFKNVGGPVENGTRAGGGGTEGEEEFEKRKVVKRSTNGKNVSGWGPAHSSLPPSSITPTLSSISNTNTAPRTPPRKTPGRSSTLVLPSPLGKNWEPQPNWKQKSGPSFLHPTQSIPTATNTNTNTTTNTNRNAHRLNPLAEELMDLDPTSEGDESRDELLLISTPRKPRSLKQSGSPMVKDRNLDQMGGKRKRVSLVGSPSSGLNGMGRTERPLSLEDGKAKGKGVEGQGQGQGEGRTPEKTMKKKRRISDSPTRKNALPLLLAPSSASLVISSSSSLNTGNPHLSQEETKKNKFSEMRRKAPTPPKPRTGVTGHSASTMMVGRRRERGTTPGIVTRKTGVVGTGGRGGDVDMDANEDMGGEKKKVLEVPVVSRLPMMGQVRRPTAPPQGTIGLNTTSVVPIKDERDGVSGTERLAPFGTTSSGASLQRVASRRESLNGEAKGSLYGLSAALAKLQVKTSLGAASVMDTATASTSSTTTNGSGLKRQGGFAMPTASSSAKSVTTPVEIDRPAMGLKRSSTMTGTKRFSSLAGVANSLPTESSEHLTSMTGSTGESNLPRSSTNLQDLMESATGNGCLKGVVAFVDVRTAEGDDAGTVFADMLRTCGAKVLAKPSESCTHIIYKSGKSSTMSWYRRQPDPKPLLVGISWVTHCKEAGKRVEEDPYEVNPDEMALFKKRRKSMEPKQLALSPEEVPSFTVTAPETSFASLAQARRRSMQFVPRVSSPLALRKSPTMSSDEDSE